MAYITAGELRDEGVPNPPYNDAWCNQRIALAEDIFNRLTGFFFEAKPDYTVKLDGTGTEILALPVPPVSESSIDSLVYNDDTLILDTDYEILLHSLYGDARTNPKIRKLSGKWQKGKSNIVIVGTFGFVDRVSDGQGGYTNQTPALVKHAIKKIALLWMPALSDSASNKGSRIVEEVLKDYSYKLQDAYMTGTFSDRELDSLIAAFTRPIVFAV